MRATLVGFVLPLLILGLSLTLAKENSSSKLKNLEIELPEILNSDSAAPTVSDGASSKGGEKAKDGEKSKEKESVGSSEDSHAEKEPTSSTSSEDTSVATSKPTYMMKVQNLIRRVMEYLGLSQTKRKSKKMMYPEDNLDNLQYVKEVRTTVGALLGKKECWKRAACDAGSYLRSVKGKEVLIVLLEKLVPSSWTESVNHIKEAAIYKDACEYKCLED